MVRHLLMLLVLTVCLAGMSSVAEAQQADPLPLSTSRSASQEKPLTIAQQRARFAADQRMLRLEWNQWIGYEPLRPSMNSSYMSNGVQRYYIPSRGLIVSTGATNAWYW